VTVIDINCGFGPGLGSQPAMFGPLYPRLSAEELSDELTHSGIERAAIAPPPWFGGAFVDPYYETANEAVHTAVQSRPDRLFGVARASPAYGARALAVADRSLKEQRFRGLLLDAEVDRFIPSDLETLEPYVRLCLSHGVPLLIVTGIHPSRPMVFLPLAKAFPELPIILLRMGSYVPDDAVVVARLAENIFLETSMQPPREVHNAIAAIGADRVLFGSGFPFATISVEAQKIKNLDRIRNADRNAILHGNAARLFGLPTSGS
jgi:predicted TIM-barrel fold metal-dependent hydrolase